MNVINDLGFTVIVGDIERPYHLRYDNIFEYGLAATEELDSIGSNNINDRSI